MLLQLWKEDTTARAIQKENIQGLMEESQRLLMFISCLKLKLKEVQMKHEQLEKSVKMLNSSTGCLDQMLSIGRTRSSKRGFGYNEDLNLDKREVKLYSCQLVIMMQEEI